MKDIDYIDYPSKYKRNSSRSPQKRSSSKSPQKSNQKEKYVEEPQIYAKEEANARKAFRDKNSAKNSTADLKETDD